MRANEAWAPRSLGLELRVIGLVGVMALASGVLTANPADRRLAFVVAAVGLIVGLSAVMPRTLLYGLVVWLAALGMVRRLLTAPGQAGRLDPLLAVAPLAFVVLLAIAARRGAFRHASPLSTGVGVLSVLVIVGVLNPLQGTVKVGAAGLLFMLVPLLAFWIGRGLCDDLTMGRLLRLVGCLALCAGVYGLVQTFSHFPAWDEAWILKSGYAALHVGSRIRAFGTFSSSEEYALFLAIGLGTWVTYGLEGPRFVVTLGAIGTLAVAIFYESGRGVVVALVLALGVSLAARRRFPPVAGVLVGLVGLASLLLVAARLDTGNFGSGPTSVFVAHQMQGLGDPFGGDSSTLAAHLDLGGQGVRSALEYPFGLGTGAVTIAATKFGGLAAGTELDPSNAATALGLPGLLAYAAVAILGLLAAYRLAERRRDALSVTILFVLIVTIFQWLNGGLYAVSFLPWLALGWVDRATPRALGTEHRKRGDLPMIAIETRG